MAGEWGLSTCMHTSSQSWKTVVEKTYDSFHRGVYTCSRLAAWLSIISILARWNPSRNQWGCEWTYMGVRSYELLGLCIADTAEASTTIYMGEQEDLRLYNSSVGILNSIRTPLHCFSGNSVLQLLTFISSHSLQGRLYISLGSDISIYISRSPEWNFKNGRP